MNFFPPVTPVQVQGLDLADIQKNNIGNAMARVGLQNMQDEMSARKAMGEFITQNGGIPQSTDQVNQLAMTLASRGLPMDKAFEVASKAQQFSMGNMELGAMQQFMAPRGSQQPGQGAPGAPIPGLAPPGAPQAGQMPQGQRPMPQPMSDPLSRSSAPGGEVGSIPMADIMEAAKTAGAEDLGPALARFVSAESGGNPNAQASTSSARGLGQFTGPTRQSIMNRHGVDAWSPDPKQQLLALAYLAKESRGSLAQSMGVDESQISPGQLYMSHFLGQAGAPKFLNGLQSNPSAPAIQFASPQAVQANSGIFFGKSGQPRTVQQVYDLMAAKVEPQGDQPMPQPGESRQPAQAMPQSGSSSPLMADLRDRVTNAPAALMVPRIAAMVKAASELGGFISPQDKAQLDLWVAKQTKGYEKQLDVANAGSIARNTETGKGMGALDVEKAGGAPVSPTGVADAAGMKSGAEAAAKVQPAVNQKAIDQIIDEQKGAREQLDQIAQRKARLVKAAESPMDGAGVSFMTSIAPILDVIVPEGASGWISKKNAELQQAGMKGAGLQKALAQESANMIAQNVGLHRGGEWALDLAKSANPQASMTAAQRNQIISDINDQLDMQAKSAQDLLGHSTNTDADMLNKLALDRNLPVLQSHGDRIGKALQTATAPIEAKSGVQGKGMTFSSLDNLKTAVSRGDINVSQAREIARANGWVQ